MSFLLQPKDKLVGEIVKALGLKHCRKLTLHFELGALVTVTAECYVEKDGFSTCAETMKTEYVLVNKEDFQKCYRREKPVNDLCRKEFSQVNNDGFIRRPGE